MPWGHSPDEEVYHGAFDTREEAIEDGRATHDGDFWIIEGAYPDVGSLMPDADRILELAGEDASAEYGEVAEEWPDVTEEARAELDAFIKAWSEKHAQPRFWQATGKAERIEHEPLAT